MKEKSEVHEYRLQIQEKDIDLLGHVNNATYFQLLEEARWAMITPLGWGREDVLKKQVSPIVLDARIRFKRELLKGENVLIRTWCHGAQGKTCQVGQSVLKPNHKEACEASFTMGLMDLKTRKLIQPPENWWRAVGLA